MASDPEVRLIATTVHGRILVREARLAARGTLVGFHGYKENGTVQMERLAAIPGAEAWRLVSVQGLHRFYRGRTEEVVASWMTRQDREVAIADNVVYVDAVVASVARGGSEPLVCAGFSQGVAMAFRAGVRGRVHAAGVIGIGGDVPPELLADPALRFPPVLLARGGRDDWFTQQKLESDVAALTARRVAVTALVFDGGHEWNAAASQAAGEFLARL